MKTNSQLGMFWVIGTLAITVYPQAATMPPHLLPLIILPLLWRLFAELKGWKPIPTLFRVAATGMSVLALVFTYGGLLGRRAAVSLLTLMLALKLLETFRVRDARVVASLSLFLCATQFLWSQGIVMFLYGVSVLIGALVSLTLLQRREAFQVTGAEPAGGHSIFAELGYSSRLLAMAVPIAITLFIFFPRWGNPLWGVPEMTLDAKSGLSESMSPGSIQSLFMDDSPAFRVNFRGNAPLASESYWRGPVFWAFDGKEWRGNYYGSNVLAKERPSDSPLAWRYTVQLEPTEQHWIFALDYPVTTPKGVRLTMDYQLYARRSITSLKSYDMISNPDFVDTAQLGNVQRMAALDLPDGFNPRTQAMVNEWRSETPSDAAFINRVLTHFNQESFHYTLNPPLLSQHTVDEFMFDTRSGFCEHYASAFTIIMRMAGIPSRIVTGYLGGWYNGIGDYLLVRQSDAHAWSEVWLPGSGWSRIDPTAAVAPDRIEQGAMGALNSRRYMFDYQWLRNAKNGFDLLQRGWNDWVIAFDSARQLSLFHPFGMGNMDARKLVTMMVTLIVLIALLMLPAILRLKLSSGLDAAGKQWLLFRRKLAGAGISSSAAMTPSELQLSASEKLHGQKKDIGEISKLYTRIRYAADSPEVSELETAVKKFKVPGKAS
jgi:transglutaminase-like putative cysteine protease